MSNANCIWLKTIGKRQPFLHSLPCGAEPVILNGINWLSAVSLAAAIAPKVVEPVCSDTLWRLIKVRRGGGRGHAQKCRLISEGLRGGQLIDQHPFVLDEHYVNSWGGQVVHEVHSIYDPYEVGSESDLEEGEVEVARPSSSSRVSDSNPRPTAKPKTAPPQALRPRVLLPDLVRLYERQNATATSAAEQGAFDEGEKYKELFGCVQLLLHRSRYFGSAILLSARLAPGS